MAEESIQPAPDTPDSTDPLTLFEAQLPGSFTGYAALQREINIDLPSQLNKTEAALREALTMLS